MNMKHWSFFSFYFYKTTLYILYIYMLRLEVWTVHLFLGSCPQKVNLFFKCCWCFDFNVIIFYGFISRLKKTHNGYISGTLLVCRTLVVECTWARIAAELLYWLVQSVASPRVVFDPVVVLLISCPVQCPWHLCRCDVISVLAIIQWTVL